LKKQRKWVATNEELQAIRDVATPQGVDLTRAVAAAAADRGVITLTCGVRGNVIRFLPPLTISEELLAEALTIIGEIIRNKS
jgi:4-aminobutyrate aminotransferase/(S)-3-amino-2-methylpropionate transaminase